MQTMYVMLNVSNGKHIVVFADDWQTAFNMCLEIGVDDPITLGEKPVYNDMYIRALPDSVRYERIE